MVHLPALLAQEATASVNGVVKDQTGAEIPTAQVELQNINTGVARTTTTNNDGVYTFLNVTPGVYMMRVSATGFTEVLQRRYHYRSARLRRSTFN